MTDLDASRKFDLEELYEARKTAKNSFYRDYYDKAMAKVIREAGNLTGLRNDLIKAVRHDDHKQIHRIQHEIQRIKLNQTGGRQDY